MKQRVLREAWGKEHLVYVHRLWDVARGQRAKSTERYRKQTLKHHPDYEAAKRQGDYAAAQRIMDDLFNSEVLDQIKKSLGDRKPKIVVPSLTQYDPENVLPVVYAQYMSRALGLDLDMEGDIFEREGQARTGKGGFYRLVNQPEFSGYVKAGENYFVLDDVFTLGGTIANLVQYIERHGGNVVAVSTFADGDKSVKFDNRRKVEHQRLGIKDETREMLRSYYDDELDKFLKEQIGYGYDGLTEREASFLLLQPSLVHIKRGILEAKDAGGPQASQRASGSKSLGGPSGPDM